MNSERLNLHRIVGYTTGTFDFVNRTHIEFLQKAKQCCDHLIVGLNSDHLVRDLKREPIMLFPQRKAILEQFQCIDEIVENNSIDKVADYAVHKYNVLCIGDEYKGTEEYKRVERELPDVRVEYIACSSASSNQHVVNDLMLRVFQNMHGDHLVLHKQKFKWHLRKEHQVCANHLEPVHTRLLESTLFPFDARVGHEDETLWISTRTFTVLPQPLQDNVECDELYQFFRANHLMPTGPIYPKAIEWHETKETVHTPVRYNRQVVLLNWKHVQLSDNELTREGFERFLCFQTRWERACHLSRVFRSTPNITDEELEHLEPLRLRRTEETTRNLAARKVMLQQYDMTWFDFLTAMYLNHHMDPVMIVPNAFPYDFGDEEVDHFVAWINPKVRELRYASAQSIYDAVEKCIAHSPTMQRYQDIVMFINPEPWKSINAPQHVQVFGLIRDITQ